MKQFTGRGREHLWNVLFLFPGYLPNASSAILDLLLIVAATLREATAHLWYGVMTTDQFDLCSALKAQRQTCFINMVQGNLERGGRRCGIHTKSLKFGKSLILIVIFSMLGMCLELNVLLEKCLKKMKFNCSVFIFFCCLRADQSRLEIYMCTKIKRPHFCVFCWSKTINIKKKHEISETSS